MSSQLPLPDDTTAPAAARRHTREVLGSWQVSKLLDPVLLIVSELVTNAVRHGRPTVWLRLLRSEHDVHIEVHDGSPTLTGPGELGEHAESGRGLDIVRAISDAHGVNPDPGGGKVSWAMVKEPSPGDHPG